MDLIMSSKIPAGKLITNRIPLSNVEEAFKIAADKNSGSIKVQVYNDYS